MDLRELDNNLKAIGNNFTRVNYGGCGCVAAMLAIALRPTFLIMRIVQVNGWGGTSGNLDSIREGMVDTHSKSEWTRNGISFGHLWVEVFIDEEWYGLDSDGIRPLDEVHKEYGIPTEGSFTIDEVQALAANETWNPEFDRTQLPAMQ